MPERAETVEMKSPFPVLSSTVNVAGATAVTVIGATAVTVVGATANRSVATREMRTSYL